MLRRIVEIVQRINSKSMLYFAYGSNLDCEQMRQRCPSVRLVCVAKLKDHRLVFPRKSQKRNCGVAGVEPRSGFDVWGVVYDIYDVDIGKLDDSEGYKPGRQPEKNAYVREERQGLRRRR